MNSTTQQNTNAALPTKRDTLFVSSLAKGFEVLEVFSLAAGSLSISEIAEILKQNRSSIQRTVHTLLKIGYLEQEAATKRFRPSAKCLEMSHNYMRCDTTVDRAWPYLVNCHQLCNETVNLSQLFQSDIIIVSRLPSLRSVSIKMNIGARAPAFCTAPGRAILAYMDEDYLSDILQTAKLNSFTSHTKIDPTAIKGELQKVHQNGYAIQSEELSLGDMSIAAPILDGHGRAIAAVNIAASTSHWSVEQFEVESAGLIQETAHQISMALRDRTAPIRKSQTFKTQRNT